LLSQLTKASHFDTNDVVWIRLMILSAFCATTEQLSFVALFCYRLRLYPAWHRILFHAAAAQAFILKTIVSIAIAGYAIVICYVNDDDATSWMWFWRFFILPSVIVMYACQLYACKILYDLGSRCRKAHALLGESAFSENIDSTEHAIEKGEAIRAVGDANEIVKD
jgi:hypothetical protein